MADIFGIGTAIQGGLDFMGTILNNTEAKSREEDARKENYEYGEKAANNAQRRALEYYNQTQSATAKMQQLADAGLSPSIYASGGVPSGGGIAAPQGQGAGNVQPHVFGMDLAQAGLMAAQIANIKADTDKKQEETNNIREDTKLKSSEILKVIADTAKVYAEEGYVKASTALTELESFGQELDNTFNQATLVDRVDEVHSKAEQAENLAEKFYYEAQREGLELEFNEQTFETRKEQIYANVNDTIADYLQKRANTALTEQQKNFVKKQVDNFEANFALECKKGHTLAEAQRIAESRLRFDMVKWENEFKAENIRWLGHEVFDTFRCLMPHVTVSNVTSKGEHHNYNNSNSHVTTHKGRPE